MHPVRAFRRLVFILAGCFFLCAFGAAVAAPPLPHVAQRVAGGLPLRIIAFGSSSTEGVGASSPAANYPSRLQMELGAMLPARETVTVANRGIGGEDIDDMMRRLPAIVAEQPDLVIWQIGSNDPLRHVPLERFEKLTVLGIKTLRAAGIDVMLMGPQLCRRLNDDPTTVGFRDAIRDIGQKHGVPVIRRYAMMREWLARKELTEVQMLSPDGLHMADGGYARLAHEVARTILLDSQRRNAVVAMN